MLKRQTQQQRHPFVSPPLISQVTLKKYSPSLRPNPPADRRSPVPAAWSAERKPRQDAVSSLPRPQSARHLPPPQKNQTSYRHGYVRRSEFYNCRFCPSARIVKIILNLVNPAAVLPALLVEKIHITVCAAFAFFHTAMPGIPNIMHYPFPAD